MLDPIFVPVMLEAKLQQSVILKRILEAMKDLCKEVNFDCDGEGIRLHAMDSSHVALVSMWLKECAFTDYKCDKHISLGMSPSWAYSAYCRTGGTPPKGIEGLALKAHARRALLIAHGSQASA